MNLTRVSALFKKSVKYFFLFFVGYYLLVYIVIPGSSNIIQSILTKKQPPVLTYGLLDQLSFVEKPVGTTKPEYLLNTKTGKVPTGLPPQMHIYEFKPFQYSYLAGKNAISDAAILGFAEKDLVSDLKGSIYVWKNSPIQSTLSIEIESKQLTLTTDLIGKGLAFTPGSINAKDAISIGQNILTSIGRFDKTYEEGYQTTRLGSFQGSKLYESSDLYETQVVLVNYYRKIGDYPILGPDPEKGLLRLYARKSMNTQNKTPMNNPFIEASYWEIVPTSKSSYPIIPVKEAWNAVKSGKGVITNVTPKGANPFDTYVAADMERILIDNIYLAYYETPKYQKYLQPIYVFSGTYTKIGDPGGYVTIYFPAVSGQYIKQGNSAPTPASK